MLFGYYKWKHYPWKDDEQVLACMSRKHYRTMAKDLKAQVKASLNAKTIPLEVVWEKIDGTVQGFEKGS
jgi:hypothetical protein